MAEIFRAYDIRGLYPSELNEELAYKIGRAFVSFLNVKSVVVGSDARLSSPQLFEALTKGINDQGADVINIGLCSTPMFYFCSGGAEASIMVTASHNPKEFNGFKLCRENAFPISEENGIKDIQRLVQDNNFAKAEKGEITQKNCLDSFIKQNLGFLENIKPLRIILDSGNGMSGYTFPKIFEQIEGVDLITLYEELDFSFPNHEANPLNFDTLKDLQKEVVKEKADFGIATDGDGDRCIFIDETGGIISSDLTTALIAIQILKHNPRTSIMYDIRCSKIVKETIEQNGGKAVMSRVGHSFIKKQMRENDILFAGELSGHLYFKENNYAESAFISTAYIMNLLSSSGKKLSELVAPLHQYFFTGEINSKVINKETMMTKIESVYKDSSKEIMHLDGLSMYFEDWWFNLRPSNTENLLRLNLEANSNELMVEKKQELLNLIRS
jgi:phosphomannomutase